MVIGYTGSRARPITEWQGRPAPGSAGPSGHPGDPFGRPGTQRRGSKKIDRRSRRSPAAAAARRALSRVTVYTTASMREAVVLAASQICRQRGRGNVTPAQRMRMGAKISINPLQ